MNITRDEWMAEIDRIMAEARKGQGGMTRREIQHARGGCSAHAALAWIARGIEAGILIVDREWRTNLAGIAHREVVYRRRESA